MAVHEAQDYEALEAVLGYNGGGGDGAFLKELFQAVVHGAKAANAIPTEDDDYHFRMNTDATYRDAVHGCRTRLVTLLQSLLDRSLPSLTIDLDTSSRGTEEMAMGDSTAFEAISDAVDMLTEEVDKFLDDPKGQMQGQGQGVGQGGGSSAQQKLLRGALQQASAAHAGSLGGLDVVGSGRLGNEHKVQSRFVDRPTAAARARTAVFVPKVSVKPHATQQPLDARVLRAAVAAGAGAPATAEAATEGAFEHVYAAEIAALSDGGRQTGSEGAEGVCSAYAPWMLKSNPQRPKPSILVLDPEDAKEAAAAAAETAATDRTLAPEATFVDDLPSFEAMLAELADSDPLAPPRVRELAVDLEAHSYRAFQSFTCLMQLSTRDKDYLVDTLALRCLDPAAHGASGGTSNDDDDDNDDDKGAAQAKPQPNGNVNILERLNVVFADPRVVKVMHGADSDILWLQRDCGLYVVNLFDTGQAARVLEYPGFGLAYLLRLHCRVNTQKAYQRADWRQRPLPIQMRRYAQADTHYLLHIYDIMKGELLGQRHSASSNAGSASNVSGDDKLLEVLRRSNDVALQCAAVPGFDCDDATTRLLERSGAACGPSGFFIGSAARRHRVFVSVVGALLDWRDEVARLEDESVEYVLPQKRLLRVARGGDSYKSKNSRFLGVGGAGPEAGAEAPPVTVAALQRCLQPLPPLVRSRQHELVERISEAVATAEAEADVTANEVTLHDGSNDVPSNASAIAPLASSTSTSAAREIRSGGGRDAATAAKEAGLPDVEQLYATAGWLPGVPDAISTPPAETLDAKNEARRAAAGLRRVLQLLAKANVEAAVGGDADTEAGSALHIPPRLALVDATAGVNASAGSAGTTGVSLAAAEAIRSNFAPHEILLQPLTSWLAHGQQPKTIDTAGGDGHDKVSEPETVLDDETLDAMPKSISEVYGIANRNKRRKTRKPVLASPAAMEALVGAGPIDAAPVDESSGVEDDSDADAAVVDGYELKPADGNTSGAQQGCDVEQFTKDVGWGGGFDYSSAAAQNKIGAGISTAQGDGDLATAHMQINGSKAVATGRQPSPGRGGERRAKGVSGKKAKKYRVAR